MRIRVLELPMVVLGQAAEQPFMLVVDRCPAQLVTEHRFREIGKEAGARTVLVTNEEVELD